MPTKGGGVEKRDLTPGSHLSAVARHTAASVEKGCSFEAYRSSQALLVPLGTALIIAAFAILHFGDLVSFDLGGNGRALGVLLDDAVRIVSKDLIDTNYAEEHVVSMLLFVIVQKMGIGGENGVFGWITLLIAHITFNVPYVIFNVGPKLRQLDGSLYNAALDLGCTPRQAFFKVILPQLSPAVMSAFLICLTYSIDDFMISYFNCGTMQTLPIAIYSMTRKKVSPEINALSAIMFVVILTIILAANAVDSAKERRLRRAARAEEGRR